MDWFAAKGPIAADHGVRLMLEPIFPLMRPFSYVHTLKHALRLVGDTEGAGVCVDLGHLWWDPEVLDDFRANVDRVVTVQVTDVESAALADFRYEREQLGRGDVPLQHLVGEIEAAGYRGFYEIEILVRIRERSASPWSEMRGCSSNPSTRNLRVAPRVCDSGAGRHDRGDHFVHAACASGVAWAMTWFRFSSSSAAARSGASTFTCSARLVMRTPIGE